MFQELHLIFARSNRLVAAIKLVIRNYPALATNFELGVEENDIVQKIHLEFFIKVVAEEISDNKIDELSRTLIQPFNINSIKFQRPTTKRKIPNSEEI